MKLVKFCPRIIAAATLSMAVVALAVAAAGPGLDRASAAGRFAHCGSQQRPGAGWGNVRALHTRCPTARHVARHYWKHWSHGDPDHRFEGWRCRDRQVGEELWKGRCNRTLSSGVRQKVRFEFGF
jgi:hypothetical protein